MIHGLTFSLGPMRPRAINQKPKRKVSMLAKFKVTKVESNPGSPDQRVEMMAVTDKPFDAAGNSDDNTFARWTPDGRLSMTITNPALTGTIKEGQKYYLLFNLADDSGAIKAAPAAA